jgi:hypothetical protein
VLALRGGGQVASAVIAETRRNITPSEIRAELDIGDEQAVALVD